MLTLMRKGEACVGWNAIAARYFRFCDVTALGVKKTTMSLGSKDEIINKKQSRVLTQIFNAFKLDQIKVYRVFKNYGFASFAFESIKYKEAFSILYDLGFEPRSLRHQDPSDESVHFTFKGDYGVMLYYWHETEVIKDEDYFEGSQIRLVISDSYIR